MTHRLATNYAKNYCNRTPIVKVIVENVVTCFFGTQCRYYSNLPLHQYYSIITVVFTVYYALCSEKNTHLLFLYISQKNA